MTNHAEIRPFRIEVPQSDLDDLHDRLVRTRWTDEVEGAGWDYGTNLGYLKRLVEYWQTSFDWREQEAKLNEFSHFKTEIDGIGIHFIHERGKGPNPTLLLLTHGWPDSFYRFYKLIPMLTDPERYGGEPKTPSMWSSRRCRDTASPTAPPSPASACGASPNSLTD